MQQGRKREALRLASSLFWLILIVLGSLTVVWFAVADLIMPLFTGTLSPSATILTVGLSRVLFPVVLLLSLTGLLVGILQSYDRFTIPALAPALLERGDRRRACRSARPFSRPECGLRVRDRLADRNRRPVAADRLGRQATPLPVLVRHRLQGPGRAGGADPVPAGHAQHRDHQPRRVHQRRSWRAGLAPGARGDQRRVPDLHAAPGGVQRRGRDGPVPDPEPDGDPPRRRRDAPDGRQWHPPDQPAADPVGGADGGACDADRTAGLSARGVHRVFDPSDFDGAVLVRVQPSVRGRQPAARAGPSSRSNGRGSRPSWRR